MQVDISVYMLKAHNSIGTAAQAQATAGLTHAATPEGSQVLWDHTTNSWDLVQTRQECDEEDDDSTNSARKDSLVRGDSHDAARQVHAQPQQTQLHLPPSLRCCSRLTGIWSPC